MDRIFINGLKKHFTVSPPIEEADCNLEDFDTAVALVNSLVALMEAKRD